MICGSGGSKSRLAKAAGAEPCSEMRDKKLHAVVARNTFPSQNVQSTSALEHFWKLRCRKAPLLWAKHISKSKCTKHTMLRPRLEVEMPIKCTPLWREAHFEVKSEKNTMLGPLLEVEMSKKCTPLWREAHFEVKSGKKLRGTEHFWTFRCGFVWAQYFRQVEWKNCKTHWYEAVSCALNFPFLKNVSQNCFVFDVVNFENWGSLADMFRFWRCQVQKLRKSRKIAPFSSLQTDRQTDKQKDRQTDRETERHKDTERER